MLSICRHAESLANIGHSAELNTDLSIQGKKQAKQLQGQYDLVIISPMKRALKTFALSNIIANQVYIEPLFRERIYNQTDMLEPREKIETEEDFQQRILNIRKYLVQIRTQYPLASILIISHGITLAYLFGKRLHNAQLMTLT